MTKEKKVKNVNVNEGNEFSKLIKLIIIVTVIFLIFYAITYFVNKKDVEETETTTKIQYDEILIGNMLMQPNDEYYVMVYDTDDYQTVVYNAYLSLYNKKEDAIRVYTANLNNPLNDVFKSDKSNFKIKKITDLKLKSSALLKIKDDKIQKYYEGDKIIEHLKKISKEEEETKN